MKCNTAHCSQAAASVILATNKQYLLSTVISAGTRVRAPLSPDIAAMLQLQVYRIAVITRCWYRSCVPSLGHSWTAAAVCSCRSCAAAVRSLAAGSRIEVSTHAASRCTYPLACPLCLVTWQIITILHSSQDDEALKQPPWQPDPCLSSSWGGVDVLQWSVSLQLCNRLVAWQCVFLYDAVEFVKII